MSAFAHELKTPLGAIMGYAEMLAGGHVAPDRIERHAGMLWEAAQALSGTVDAMLDLARFSSGEMDMTDDSFHISDCIESAARMLATSASAHNVQIDMRVPPDLPPLLGDSRMMRQVVVNLLSNAIKYGPDGGRIRVTARIDRQGRMALEVMDNGPGISAAEIDVAMRPFGRLRRDNTIPGHGLGLPLTKALVELHEGTFRLVGTSGKGTRAIVLLPASRVQRVVAGGQESFIFSRPPAVNHF
nr:HAMP domain-containing sensor histidine kinase [Pacificimonas pallii]